MTRDERTLNSYALRNAILLAVYGLYGIVLLPILYHRLFTKHIPGTFGSVILTIVGIRFLSYIVIGFAGMMRTSRIRANHSPLSILFFVFFGVNLFIGVYLSAKDGLQTPPLTALSLSSLLIAAVMVYYFALFQLKETSPSAFRMMAASLLFFTGGGEIFFHQFKYVNTIMGWFMIWTSLNGPDRALWKSFVLSIVGSMVFYLPRFALPKLKEYLIENEIMPLSLIYVSFGVILAVVAILLRIKTRSIPVEKNNGTVGDAPGFVSRK